MSGTENCKCKATEVGKWGKCNDWNYSRVENSKNELILCRVLDNS